MIAQGQRVHGRDARWLLPSAHPSRADREVVNHRMTDGGGEDGWEERTACHASDPRGRRGLGANEPWRGRTGGLHGSRVLRMRFVFHGVDDALLNVVQRLGRSVGERRPVELAFFGRELLRCLSYGVDGSDCFELRSDGEVLANEPEELRVALARLVDEAGAPWLAHAQPLELRDGALVGGSDDD